MAHKIIVGIDYGTTFTGISFVVSTKSSFEDIHVIRNWPGPAKDADEVWKTPSRIAYSSENKDCSGNAWGFSVTPKMKSYTWTKLLLDKNTQLTKHDDNSLGKKYDQAGYLRLPIGKSASDVVSDYLYEIYKFLLAELEKRLSAEVVKVTSFEFWFTVPAIWSDKAKDDTRRAAQHAGFGSRPNDKVYMIPEPQAAAIATLKSLTHSGEDESVKSGDGVLICDCGGGTVDITTYLIRKTHPTLEFEELVVGGGGKCGSTAIDREFLAWMSRTFGRPFDDLKYEKIGPGSRFMKEFEGHKRDFGISNQSSDDYEVPLVIPGVRNSINYDVDESTVKFYKSDMETFFKPVVEKVTSLLKQQIDLANTEAMRGARGINRVILVGGFGDSRYLNDKLRAWCSKRGIRVLCPPNPQAAIVKGAALRGLENIEPIRTRCRRHYGFDLSLEFREGLDPESDGWMDSWNDIKLCRRRMEWQLSKGAYVDQDTFIKSEVCFTVSRQNVIKQIIDLWSCSFEAQPDRTTDVGVEHVGRIECDFSSMDLDQFESKYINGEKQWNICYTVEVRMGSKEGVLCFDCKSNGKKCGTAFIEYGKN